MSRIIFNNPTELVFFKLQCLLFHKGIEIDLYESYKIIDRLGSGSTPMNKGLTGVANALGGLTRSEFTASDFQVSPYSAFTMARAIKEDPKEYCDFKEAVRCYFTPMPGMYSRSRKKRMRYIGALGFFIWSNDSERLKKLISGSGGFEDLAPRQNCYVTEESLVSAAVQFIIGFYGDQPGQWGGHGIKADHYFCRIPEAYYKEADQGIIDALAPLLQFAAATGIIVLDSQQIAYSLGVVQHESLTTKSVAMTGIDRGAVINALMNLLNAGMLPPALKSSPNPIVSAFYKLSAGDLEGVRKVFTSLKRALGSLEAEKVKKILPSMLLPLEGLVLTVKFRRSSQVLYDSYDKQKAVFGGEAPPGSVYHSFLKALQNPEGEVVLGHHSFDEIFSRNLSYGSLFRGVALISSYVFLEEVSSERISEFAKVNLLGVFKREVADAVERGSLWMAFQLARAAGNGFGKDGLTHSDIFSPETKVPEALGGKFPSLAEEVIVKLKWEVDLEQLMVTSGFKPPVQVGDGSQKSKVKKKQPRRKVLVWVVSDLDDGELSVSARTQILLGNGQRSTGRGHSLKTLMEQGLPDHATDLDREILKCVDREEGYWAPYYSLSFSDAKRALQKHPYVFSSEDLETKLAITATKPKLCIEVLADGQFCLALCPLTLISCNYQSPISYEEGIPKVSYLDQTEKQADIIALLQEKSLTFPEGKIGRFLPVLLAMSQSISIEGLVELEQRLVSKITPDIVFTCQLELINDALLVRFVLDPFREKSFEILGNTSQVNTRPRFEIGEADGLPVLFKIEETCYSYERDIEQEKLLRRKLVSEINRRISEAEGGSSFDGGWISVDDVSTLNIESSVAFEALDALQNMAQTSDVAGGGAPSFFLEWAENSKKIRTYGGENTLKLSLDSSSRRTDWFSISGEFKIDELTKISIDSVLTALVQNRVRRFIPMGDGRFLRLTKELSARLAALGRMKDANSDGELTASALLPLQSLLESDDVEFDCDATWGKRLQECQPGKIKVKKVPKIFLATLRSYQLEGFQWLQKMAQLGFGACLADDMGLGKTIQCLAFLALRIKKGAALVVAPTSLTYNWAEEIKTHCPAFKVIILNADHRLDEDLNPKSGEIYLLSYGQMARDVERADVVKLASFPKWDTLILDECQAIKNSTTLRSRSARKISARFKIGVSGTPIENHLGEIWSLFDFLNSGLLGTGKRFKATYSGKNAGSGGIESLSSTISPFLLRRTKNAVLKELPSKVEKTLIVAASPQEATFYGTLQEKLVARLEMLDPRKRYIETLSALTTLRQAACHPILVAPELTLPSAKHEALHNLLQEVISNGHQVLVFSQFVRHLKLVREYLDVEGIGYQYLDGSTPVKKRAEAVKNFQQGDGSVFLISLKAGGFGLNLTAADYVIHLDPWWNPAVEDQASDRSHRIGQEKTVHVYRIVTKGTIEEKILALHKEKRDLTDQILSDKTKASAYSGDELFRLISEI